MAQMTLQVMSKKAVRRLRQLQAKNSVAMVKSLAKSISDIFNRAAQDEILGPTGNIYFRDKKGELRTRAGTRYHPSKITGRTSRLQRALGGGSIDLSDWIIPRTGSRGTLRTGKSRFLFGKIKTLGTIGATLDFFATFGIRGKGDKGMEQRLKHEFGGGGAFKNSPKRPFLNPASDKQRLLYEKLYKRFARNLLNTRI